MAEFQYIWHQFHRRKTARYLFLFLCLNLVIAPALQAGNDISRPQAYALGILGLATFSFSIYLFVVMFQPERF